MEIHALTRGLMLIEAIGVRVRRITYDVPVTSEDHQRVRVLLERHGIDGSRPLVAVNPVALWETKLWRNDRFARLAEHLIKEKGATVVFTGGPADKPVNDAIRAMMTVPAVNLAGQTSIKMLAALYCRSAMLITTDTGPMHLAAALGTPVVALFGPTAPWRTGPFGEGHRIVRTAAACSPCFKRRCDERQCCCMHNITVEMVIDAVDKLHLL
jgi:lipopolysaccharide heptosyltransferase II